VTERIHQQRDRYLARYGIVPGFDVKKEIVHSGDTVNTAARIEAECRPLDVACWCRRSC